MVLNSVGIMLLNWQGTRGQRLAREVIVRVSSVFTSSDISNETSCHRQSLVWNFTEKKKENRGLGKYFRLFKTETKKEMQPISLNFALICLFPCTTRN